MDRSFHRELMAANREPDLNSISTHSVGSTFSPQDIAQARDRIQDLLSQLAATYPTDTAVDQKIFVEKFDQATQELHEVARILMTQGDEPMRGLCLLAELPGEMGHRLYQILVKNSRRVSELEDQPQ